MTKKPYKLYLEPEDYRRLVLKANEFDFTGKGAVARLMEKVACTDIIFTDGNVRKFAKLLNLEQKQDG